MIRNYIYILTFVMDLRKIILRFQFIEKFFLGGIYNVYCFLFPDFYVCFNDLLIFNTAAVAPICRQSVTALSMKSFECVTRFRLAAPAASLSTTKSSIAWQVIGNN